MTENTVALGNDWRHLRPTPWRKPGAAHLFTTTPSGMGRSCCGRVLVRDVKITTERLTDANTHIHKCRICIPHEQRRKESA